MTAQKNAYTFSERACCLQKASEDVSKNDKNFNLQLRCSPDSAGKFSPDDFNV